MKPRPKPAPLAIADEDDEFQEGGYRQSDPAAQQKLRAKERLLAEAEHNRVRLEEEAQRLSPKQRLKVTEAFVPPEVYSTYVNKWFLCGLAVVITVVSVWWLGFTEYPWWALWFPIMISSGLTGAVVERVGARWLRRVGPQFEATERAAMASAPFAVELDPYLNEMVRLRQSKVRNYVCYCITFLDEVPEPAVLQGLLGPDESVSMVDETCVVVPPETVLVAGAYSYYKETLHPVLRRLHEGYPLLSVTFEKRETVFGPATRGLERGSS